MESIFCQDESAGERAVVTQTCPQCGHEPATPGGASGDVAPTGDARSSAGMIESQELRISYMPARIAPEDQRALVPTKPQRTALATVAQFSALAWQQPIVRSAVRTGTSAVALTVALRVASRIIASRGAREVARQSLLPALAELVSPAESDARPLRRSRRARRDRGEQVSEVFIYMRRTTQRQ